MNNCPVATARMYNYLVIFGVFRSLCVILLISLWFESFYIIDVALRGSNHASLFSLGLPNPLGQGVSFAILVTLYVFSLFPS
jgi:hypothetical protein